MSKKDTILNNNKAVDYDLTNNEKIEVASLIVLISQARAAQDFIYSQIVQRVADRLNVSDKDISLNFEEIMEQGTKIAKLVVKD